MLARIRKAMKDKEEGFTLIELLVVMIIIGILAAIAIPVFLSQRQKGYDASVKSDLRTIANELESYNTDQQAYPAITGGVVSTNGVTTIGTDPTTVRTSSGNLFTYVLSTGGVGFSAAGAAYCLTGINAKGTHAWEYISSLGGLQPASTFTAAPPSPNAAPACATATTNF
jgi:type IV pilus assembly protein PilA